MRAAWRSRTFSRHKRIVPAAPTTNNPAERSFTNIMRLIRLIGPIGLIGLIQLPALAAEENWLPLFNGRDLSGWTEHSGKAKYTVEDGVLIGTAVSGTGNSFLCTTQE